MSDLTHNAILLSNADQTGTEYGVGGKVDSDDSSGFYDEYESTTTFSGNTVTETFADNTTKVTVFNANGSITETYPDGKVFLTTFGDDGSVTKTEVTN